jgi:hypothetical protein
VDPDTPATQRLGAIKSFLLDHDALLPALASRLGGRGAEFETAIRGSSMSPAIPAGARLRVRLIGERACNSGDIVLFASDSGFMVHRIVYQTPGRPDTGYLLTFGDNCLVPDLPVSEDRLLGTVVAIQTATGWRPPGSVVGHSFLHRLVRAITLVAMTFTLRLSVPAARRLAAILATLERAGRAPAGRLLRTVRQALLHPRLRAAMSPFACLIDRIRHREVRYLDLRAARINTLFPVARRSEVARATADFLVETDRLAYFKNLSGYNHRQYDLPRGIPALDDLYPPNFAVLDFLARHVAKPENEILLDFACGIGALLVYERDLGFAHAYGYDNWSYLARSTAEQFLRRFGLPGSALVNPEDLDSIPVTIVTCVGFPLTLLTEKSNLLAKPSVRYLLADRMGRPAVLPGFTRTGEYPGLLTIFEKSRP